MAVDTAEEAPQFVQANSSSGLEYLLHPVRPILFLQSALLREIWA